MISTTMSGLITALKEKVDAVTASGNGSPEDLAMIATAVEKIAGRITALELEAVGETERQSITDLALRERTTFANALASELTTANATAAALIAGLNADMAAAENNISRSSGIRPSRLYHRAGMTRCSPSPQSAQRQLTP